MMHMIQMVTLKKCFFFAFKKYLKILAPPTKTFKMFFIVTGTKNVFCGKVKKEK